MKVVLNSRDTGILEVCRRTLQNLRLAKDFGLIIQERNANELANTRDADERHAPGDLEIWDLDCISKPLECVPRGSGRRSIIIVSRERIGWIPDSAPDNVAAILLKPISEGPLRACLEQVLEAPTPRESDSTSLLQLMLEAIVRLQQYDRDRTNFLARGVHDFRAPMTALRGYCGLLLDQQFGPLDPCQAEILSRMKHSVDRLSKMAEDMFQLSVGSRCGFKLKLEETDLSTCVDQAVYEVMPFLKEKDIDLMVDVAALPKSVHIDRAQIEQVLINILENACKFTPRHGSIRIGGHPFFWERRRLTVPVIRMADRRQITSGAPNTCRIDIQDSAPAIPTAQLSTIFDEYTSGVGGEDRSGAGLGLAICKLIISRHQGCIWAEPARQGNTFSFVLPTTAMQSHTLKLAC